MSVENPPGWHPDPVGRHEHRYWDGSQWTDHVADQGTMSTDPLQAAPPQETAPIGPSMVNLPAINPADLQVSLSQPAPAAAEPAPAPEPEPTPTPAAAEPAPAGVAPPATMDYGGDEPTSLALPLSLIAPGAGHLYLGGMAKREVGFGLLGATVVSWILMWFISFPLGLIVYLAALAFALFDLRSAVLPVINGGVAALGDIGSPLAWRIIGAGGVATAVGLLLPWYRIKTDVEIGGRSESASSSASGFDSFEGLDFVLLVIGVAAIVLAAIHISQAASARGLPPALPLALSVAGGIAWVLVLYRILSVPGAAEATDVLEDFGGASVDITIGRGPGAIIDWGGTLAVMFGGLAAMSAQRRGA